MTKFKFILFTWAIVVPGVCLAQGDGPSQSPTPMHSCEVQIASGSFLAGVPTLSPQASQELVAIAAGQRDVGVRDSVARVRQVVEGLVRTGALTEAQAQIEFSERVLGQFGNIFLRYTIAELKSRSYSQSQVINFVLHFDQVFTAEEQVDFAIAVAKRVHLMLYERPSTKNPEEFGRYIELVKAFGVSPEIYASFLRVWEVLSKSDAKTIVYFILENIRSAGEEVNEQVEAILAEQSRAVMESSKRTGFLGIRWLGRRRPAPLIVLKPDEVAESILDVHGIPLPLLLPIEFSVNQNSPPPIFELIKGQISHGTSYLEGEARHLISSLDRYSRVYREYFLAKVLPYMNGNEVEDVLRRSQGGGYPGPGFSLSENLVVRLHTRGKIFADFFSLHRQVVSLLEGIKESALQSRTQEVDPGPPTPLKEDWSTTANQQKEEIDRLTARFESCLRQKKLSNLAASADRIGACVKEFAELVLSKSYKRSFYKYGFVHFSTVVIERVFEHRKLRPAVAAMAVLLDLSKRIELNSEFVQRIFDATLGKRLFFQKEEHSFQKSGEFQRLRNPDNWGYRPAAPKRAADSRDSIVSTARLSGELRQLLVAQQNLLAEHNQRVTTEELFDLQVSHFLKSLGPKPERGSGSRGVGCFTGETPVLTPNGYAAIGDLRVGDLVYSYDVQERKLVANPIVDILRHAQKEYFHLQVPGGRTISVTDTQRFYSVTRADYLPLGDIGAEEDLFLIPDGRSPSGGVTFRRGPIESQGHADVFELSLAHEPHNYIVNGVLVHNVKKVN